MTRPTAHGLTAEEAVLGLTAAEQATVRDILTRTVPDAAVAVFGSRATGRARPHSDLDLLVTPSAGPLTWAQLADLRDAFEASRLPFRVDVVEVDSLAPGMAARIRAEARPLCIPPQTVTGSSTPKG